MTITGSHGPRSRAAQRDARPVEHLEEVDVVLLEGDREGDAAEVVERPPLSTESGMPAPSVKKRSQVQSGPAVDQLVDALEARLDMATW